MKSILEPVYKLNKEEQEILDSYNRGEWKSVKNLTKRREELKRSADITLKLIKSKNINLRLQPATIDRLKNKAEKLGMPYQTLAASVLHRYATGQTIHPD